MTQQPSLDFTVHQVLVMGNDPSERKHGGNPQSVAAHSRVLGTKSDVYKRIMDVIRVRGGATSKEIAAALGRQLNCLSGRCTELRAMGLVKDSGLRRGGAAVLVLK